MADKAVSYTQKVVTGAMVKSLSFTRNGSSLEYQAVYEQQDSTGAVRGYGAVGGTTTVAAALASAFATSLLAACNTQEGT